MHFLTEVVHLIFRQTAFHERARVNPWGNMTLEIHQIAAILCIARTEEVVEAHFVESRSRLEGSHVTTQLQILFRRTQYCHDRVPTNGGTNAAFQIKVTRICGLIFNRDGVNVVAASAARSHFHTTFACFGQYLINQELSALNTFFTDNRFDRLQPVTRFDRIHVIVQTF